MQIIKLISFACLWFLLNSCTTEQNKGYHDFIIYVDEIFLPDTISVNDTLSIKFNGLIGTDGCHTFKHFDVASSGSTLNITLWGTKPVINPGCNKIMVYLDGKEYKTKFSKPGLYKIIVTKSENHFITDSVLVKQ